MLDLLLSKRRSKERMLKLLLSRRRGIKPNARLLLWNKKLKLLRTKGSERGHWATMYDFISPA
jgi:hypothetical protein